MTTRPSTGKPRVLVLGASEAIRASLSAATRAGFHVIAADGSDVSAADEAAESAVVAIDNPDVVTNVVRASRVDGIIATTDHAVLPAAVAAQTLGLPGISPEAAVRATQKAEMRKCWESARIPGPLSGTARTNAEILDVASRLGLPLVIKPANALGGGSRGVSVARDHDEFQQAIAFARQFANDGMLLLEQCVNAISEHSVELLFVDGHAYVIAIGDKVKSPAPYRVDLEVRYPTALSVAEEHAVSLTAVAAARAIGIQHGMAHVELATTPQGVMLFELGARCGGGATAAPLVPWVTGIDEFVEACRVACGLKPQFPAQALRRGGCYRFITPAPGTVVSHEPLERVRQIPGVLEAALWAKDGAIADVVRTGRDRCGAIVTGGATREEAIALANEAANELELVVSARS